MTAHPPCLLIASLLELVEFSLLGVEGLFKGFELEFWKK